MNSVVAFKILQLILKKTLYYYTEINLSTCKKIYLQFILLLFVRKQKDDPKGVIEIQKSA